MNILGIDAAYSTTGYAVLEKETKKLIDAGKIITSPKYTDDVRIEELFDELMAIIKQYDIDVAIMEDGFSGTNRKTSMQLSYLRGGLTLLLRHNKILVEKQLPSTIRKNIGVGGNAKKEQVAEKVSIIYQNNVLLNQIGPYSDRQNKNKTSDIYDAISIAYSYCV